MNFYEQLQKQFVIPVLRETDGSKLEALALDLAAKGSKILELTLMSDAGITVIKKLSSRSDLIIGAGTVLNEDLAKKAVDSGAKFIVTPGFTHSVQKVSEQNKIPFIPGVLTPTEIMHAMTHGCDLIKLFPISSVGGASYLKQLNGPFPNTKWMPSGGIRIDDIKEYKDAGAFCIGIGGRKFN